MLDQKDAQTITILIERGRWRRSPGYAREDGEWVGPHEYIVRKNDPETFDALKKLLSQSPDGYYSEYKGSRYRYVNIEGWKYWSFQIILNREKLPDG